AFELRLSALEPGGHPWDAGSASSGAAEQTGLCSGPPSPGLAVPEPRSRNSTGAVASRGTPAGIDKSALTIGEPKRYRDKAHLKLVASQPCLFCGRRPCDPHHLRFTQVRALGRKVSDEFTVPLCRIHHRDLHRSRDEAGWWAKLGI